MNKTRLEAFTDAVIAIVMTLLILEVAAPGGDGFRDLWALRYKFLVYIISFVTLAVYWNNHHHLLQAAKHINGRVLWFNMAFIFFLTLFPFATAWVDENLLSVVPQVAYGLVVLCADAGYWLLARALVGANGAQSEIARALSGSRKSVLTMGLVALGVVVGFWLPPAVLVCCAVSLCLWAVPERRIENLFSANS